MSFFGGVDGLELFLTRSRALTVASVPAYVAVMVFFLSEEGWRFSLLLCCVLPPIAAYLGIRGKREIRGGLAAAGLTLSVVTLPLALLLSLVEGA